MLNKQLKVYLSLRTSLIFLGFLQLFSSPLLFLLLCLLRSASLVNKIGSYKDDS